MIPICLESNRKFPFRCQFDTAPTACQQLHKGITQQEFWVIHCMYSILITINHLYLHSNVLLGMEGIDVY
jgi:hypothetical protein